MNDYRAPVLAFLSPMLEQSRTLDDQLGSACRDTIVIPSTPGDAAHSGVFPHNVAAAEPYGICRPFHVAGVGSHSVLPKECSLRDCASHIYH